MRKKKQDKENKNNWKDKNNKMNKRNWKINEDNKKN